MSLTSNMPSRWNMSDLVGFQNGHVEYNEKDETGKSQANATCQDFGLQEKQVQHQEPYPQEQPPLGNQELIMEDENGDSKTSPHLPIFEQKDALALFNMINPGSSCTIEKLAGESKAIFFAVFSRDDRIQASGVGLSEEEAKRDAAENGIKLYVSLLISENLQNFGKESEEIDLPSEEKVDILCLILRYATDKVRFERRKLATEMSKPTPIFIGQKKSDERCELLIKNQYPSTVLCWSYMTSYLPRYIYEVCTARIEKKRRQGLPPKLNVKIKENRTDVKEKKLPKNSCELHPPDLLEIMNPGTRPYEVGRKAFSVKMGYKINDKVYTGIGSSKKEAKLQAAKKAMKEIYNVKY